MSRPKKVDLSSAMKTEFKEVEKKVEQETLFEESKGFVMPPKKEEKEPTGKLKNNFPLYMEKKCADKLLRLARDRGYTRNELLIEMVNSCLKDAGLDWRVKGE